MKRAICVFLTLLLCSCAIDTASPVEPIPKPQPIPIPSPPLPGPTSPNIFDPTGVANHTISAAGITVNLYSEGITHTNGMDCKVLLTGAGERTKSVLFITADVYIAVSYVSNPPISPHDMLNSLLPMKSKVIQMTLLRDVSASDIQGAFKEALSNNGIDVTSLGISNLLNHVTAMSKGTLITFVGYLNGTPMDDIFVQTGSQIFKASGVNLVIDFWKLWFGFAPDNNMRKLQHGLIGGTLVDPRRGH